MKRSQKRHSHLNLKRDKSLEQQWTAKNAAYEAKRSQS
jgi:hypothetical protein